MNTRKFVQRVERVLIVLAVGAVLLGASMVAGCSIILAYQSSDGGSCSIVQSPVQPIEVGIRINQLPTTQPSGEKHE